MIWATRDSTSAMTSPGSSILTARASRCASRASSTFSSIFNGYGMLDMLALLGPYWGRVLRVSRGPNLLCPGAVCHHGVGNLLHAASDHRHSSLPAITP